MNARKNQAVLQREGPKPAPKGDTFVSGAEGCVRETRKGVLHEDDPHFSELFEALKNAEGHALRHGPGENAEEKGHLC
jgi:hypothetical protein